MVLRAGRLRVPVKVGPGAAGAARPGLSTDWGARVGGESLLRAPPTRVSGPRGEGPCGTPGLRAPSRGRWTGPPSTALSPSPPAPFPNGGSTGRRALRRRGAVAEEEEEEGEDEDGPGPPTRRGWFRFDGRDGTATRTGTGTGTAATVPAGVRPPTSPAAAAAACPGLNPPLKTRPRVEETPRARDPRTPGPLPDPGREFPRRREGPGRRATRCCTGPGRPVIDLGPSEQSSGPREGPREGERAYVCLETPQHSPGLPMCELLTLA